MLTLLVLPFTLVVALTIPISGVGQIVFARWLRLVAGWAGWNRERAARLLGVEVPELSLSAERSVLALVRRPAVLRLLLWTPVFVLVGILFGILGLLGPGMMLNTVQMLMRWAFPRASSRCSSASPETKWIAAMKTTESHLRMTNSSRIQKILENALGTISTLKKTPDILSISRMTRHSTTSAV